MLALEPDHAPARIHGGWARLRSDPVAARADLERARLLAPAGPEIERALGLLGL